MAPSCARQPEGLRMPARRLAAIGAVGAALAMATIGWAQLNGRPA